MTEPAAPLSQSPPSRDGGSQRRRGEGLPYEIPAAAWPAWRALADALAAHGPAPCEEGHADSWWREHGMPGYDKSVEQLAQRCCGGCPARQECLDYALAADEPWGVWGGHTAAQRRLLRPGGSAVAAA